MRLAPAAQHMRDAGVGIGRPVRFMGVVHGDDIRDQLGIADEAGVIGHRLKPAPGPDEEGGMRDVMEAHGKLRHRLLPARLVQEVHPRRCIGHRDAVAGPAIVLRMGGQGEDEQEQGEKRAVHARLSRM